MKENKDCICELLGPPVLKYMIPLEHPKNTTLVVSKEVWEKLNKFAEFKDELLSNDR